MIPPRRFGIYTLVDITATGVTRDVNNQVLARNQQRNWETVIQVLSLRTQPTVINNPATFVENAEKCFGNLYTGEHTVWAFEFFVDHPDAFRIGEDPISALNDDFQQVPIITNLTETAKFLLPIFYTSGAIKNIYICSWQ